jgi:ubiquinone/menaquinone biosynthesis C-methylase UbiE
MTRTTETANRPLTDEPDWALVKQRHRAMWASGDYPAVVRDLISSLGEVLVEACNVREGQDVLDVAAGTGNAAIPAALRGAQVVASDLTPELCNVGWRESKRRGLDIHWHEADAESLPYEDGEYDVALSVLGVMFAPRHQHAADELVRVTRRGGTIGVLNWTPEGFIGQMFQTMKPFAPPAPAGALPPPLWGDPAHVEALLGSHVDSVVWERRNLHVGHFATPEAALDYLKHAYGPTIAIYKSLEQDDQRTAELDEALRDLIRRHLHTQDGRPAMEWEYLVLTARRV